jgi:quercetin dioxygenase-like cupin family protein
MRSLICCLTAAVFSIPVVSGNARAQVTQSSEDEAKTKHGGAPQVEVLPSAGATALSNPGKVSLQLLWHENSPNAQMTITRVTMQPKAVSERHSHAKSEQEWIVEKGQGTLLLANNATRAIRVGDVVRTPAGAVHGVVNSGNETLIYLSVTTPPEDFSKFYSGRGGAK